MTKEIELVEQKAKKATLHGVRQELERIEKAIPFATTVGAIKRYETRREIYRCRLADLTKSQEPRAKSPVRRAPLVMTITCAICRVCGCTDADCRGSFAEEYGQHVTTYGHPLKQSLLAAEAGNHVKIAAGWPLDQAGSLPGSLLLLWRQADEACARAIIAGSVDKRSVLETFYTLRNAIEKNDPGLAKLLTPAACEATDWRAEEGIPE